MIVFGSAAASRLAALLVLVAVGRYLDGRDAALIVVVIAVTGSALILLDPGLATFVVVLEGPIYKAAAVRRWGVTLAFACAASGALIGATPLLGGGGGPLAPTLIVITAVDACMRSLRGFALREGARLSYVLPDVSGAAARIVVAGALVAGVHLDLACLVALALQATSLTVLLLGPVRGSAAALPGAVPSWRALSRSCLPHALTTTVSSGYSQAPVLASAWAGADTTATAVALITRVTQPVELIPSTLCQLSLPGLSEDLARQARLRRTCRLAGLLLVPAVAAVALVLLVQYEALAGQAIVAVLLFALTVPVKFANYASAAILTAEGQVKDRLRAGSLVALPVVVGSVIAPNGGPAAVAALILTGEVALMALLRRRQVAFA